MNTRPEWEEKIRRDYAGVVSEGQIETTIEYWRGFIEKAEKRGAEKAIDHVLKNAGEIIENEEGAQVGVKVDILTLEAAKNAPKKESNP